MKIYISGFVLFFVNVLLAEAPIVENVRFEQRTDGSLLVDIYYDISDADDDTLDVIIEASAFYSEDWSLPCSTLRGDVGRGIPTGINKQVVWDFFADNPGIIGSGFRVRVTAYDNFSGQTIFEDTRLTEDLEWIPGTGYVIKIGAANITLDLGGYTIYGNMLTNGYTEGLIVTDVDGITIKNGTIDGFGGAIIMSNSNNTTFENLTIRNLDIEDPTIPIGGIIMGGSKGVVVRDCYFEFLYTAHKEAILPANSEVLINNIKTKGGSVGVNFAGDNNGLIHTKGLVSNSTFDSVTLAGVLFHYADSVIIENNIFKNGGGIYTDPGYSGGVRRLLIKNNDISGSDTGILFHGTIESEISNNTIYNNYSKGIGLFPNVDCGNPGIECFYSTKNLITGNNLSGNRVDLFHDEKCLGNIWRDNIYETADGIEIYQYDPITAGELFSSVDSMATNAVSDAQLIYAASTSCDTVGKSHKWIYIYQSPSQQKKYEYWVNDSRVVARDSVSVPWVANGDYVPITESWIDSDSAIAIAEASGGKEFRESSDLLTIEINLYHLYWDIHYISQNTPFSIVVDAKTD